MEYFVSDNFSYTDSDEKLAAQETAELINSSKTMVSVHRDGDANVYTLTKGKNVVARIVNAKMSEGDEGCWKFSYGKFLKNDYCVGPFTDGSEFDKNFGSKGIRKILNDKIALQQNLLARKNCLGG